MNELNEIYNYVVHNYTPRITTIKQTIETYIDTAPPYSTICQWPMAVPVLLPGS